MDRQEAEVYLSGSLGLAAAEVGVSSGPLSTLWGMAIDDALLALSVDPASLNPHTVASADVIGYRALLTYTGLVRLHEAVLASVDTSVDGPQMSKRSSQYVATLERRIEVARKNAGPYATTGPLADADGYGDFGAFNLDYIALAGTEF